jgi:hypothetical protein
MILVLIRILLVLSLVAGLAYLLMRIFNPPDFVKCGRCEGKGYWYGARGRETCDWCKGSGKLPRVRHQH